MTTPDQRAQDTMESLNARLRDHANVLRAHDTVHLDRNDCGGVGGCALMRAEHDTEQELIGTLTGAARRGLAVRVVVAWPQPEVPDAG